MAEIITKELLRHMAEKEIPALSDDIEELKRDRRAMGEPFTEEDEAQIKEIDDQISAKEKLLKKLKSL